jgi:hypothetical protein
MNTDSFVDSGTSPPQGAQTYGYIYLITNRSNGKKYIGQAVDCERRWKQHRLKTAWCRDAIALGDDLYWEIIDNAGSPEELTVKERFYILKHDTLGSGYNNAWPPGNTIRAGMDRARAKGHIPGPKIGAAGPSRSTLWRRARVKVNT